MERLRRVGSWGMFRRQHSDGPSSAVSSVDSVIDFIANGNETRAGNTYHRVDSVSAGGYTMVTYVATNIQNFPDSSSVSGQILAVRAYLHQSVSDGGVKISSWSGVDDNFALALNDFASASGVDTSSSGIPAHTRPIAVNAGGLAYTSTMGALDPNGGFTSLGVPAGFTSVGRGSDNQILEDGAFAVQANAGTVDPTWTWVYGPPARPWLVTTFSLNAAPPAAAAAAAATAATAAAAAEQSADGGRRTG